MVNETGNAINVANLEDAISFVNGYGAIYNPTNPSIKLPALNSLFTNAKNSLIAVDNALIIYNNAVNAREIVFTQFAKLPTRILNALECTTATSQTIADAKSIIRKLQGKRAKAIVKKDKNNSSATVQSPAPTPNPAPVPSGPVNISASQMSFDNRIENLYKLITLLTNEPLYVPNETDLKVAALNTLLTSLKTANTAVINANTTLANARISRNKILYAPSTGLYDVQLEIKKYVKSVYGATAPEYKEISKLKFTKPR